MGRFLPPIVLILALAIYFTSEFMMRRSTAGDAQRVIRFWGFSYPAQTMNELKGQFEQQNPDYTVEVQTVPWGSLQQKTLWAVAANSNVPDVIVGSSVWTGGLARNGALMPLDGLIEEDVLQDIYPAALGIYKFPEVHRDKPRELGELKQYGLPLDLDLPLVFYRDDLVRPVMDELKMKEFPKSWEAFQQLAKGFKGRKTAAGASQYLMSLDPEDPVPLQMAFFPSSGATILDATYRKAVFDSPAALPAFQAFRTMLRDGGTLRWSRTSGGDPVILFKTDRSAAMINGPWFAKFLESKAPEQSGKWRVALFPRRRPTDAPCGLGGACVAIPYNARNKDGALKLIRFLSQRQFALTYFRRVGTPPPQRSAWSDPVFQESLPYFGGQRVYTVVREALESAVPLQLLPDTEIIKGPLRVALERTCDSNDALEQITREAVAETNTILTKD